MSIKFKKGAIFNKMDPRREVRFTGWSLQNRDSFYGEKCLIRFLFGEKHLKNCGYHLIRGLN